MNETLHARIARCLGWPVEDTKQFPLQGLREMIREKSPKLAEEISTAIRSGSYIIGEPLRPRRRR